MAEKTYLVEFSNGKRQRITVPEEWKVTFGPVAVQNSRLSNGGERMPLALRFYESNERQRAIFTNVVGFRDLSIKVEEERVNVQEKTGYVECDGKRKQTVFQAKTRDWVDPDEKEASPELLPPADDDIMGIEL